MAKTILNILSDETVKKNTKQKPQQQQQWNSVNLFDWGEKKS